MTSPFDDKKKCCGCGACANVCPKHAITMTADEQGFVYPKIDQSTCIDCGMCRKVCGYGKDNFLQTDEQICYGGIDCSKDKARSASGASPMFWHVGL